MLRFSLLPALFSVALLSVAQAGLAAQTIEGSVVDEQTLEAVGTALVLLESVDGERIAGILSGQNGRFRLAAPGAGSYRLRVERLGYQPYQTDLLTIGVGGRVERVLVIAPRAIELEGVVAEGRGRCDLRPEEGLATYDLWERARSVLSIVSWSERDPGTSFHAMLFDRVRDLASLEVEDERTWHRPGYGPVPFHAAAPDELAKHGYVRELADGSYQYFGLDADVLLSDEFLDTHCFRVRASEGEERGLIGLAFEPISNVRQPDVKGVLWLDRETGALRHLEFAYTRHLFPVDIPTDRFGGRTEFRQLDNGAWIVERWWIRMPQFHAQVESDRLPRGSRVQLVRLPGSRVDEATLRRAGMKIRERGGEVLRTGGRPRDGSAAIEGVVHDSIAGGPLAEALVFISGTQHRAVTGPDGAFVLSNLPSGEFEVGLIHARIDSLGVAPSLVGVSLSPGATIQLDLGLPALATLLAGRCPADTEGTVVAGTVRDVAGSPVAGVEVVATWSSRWEIRAGGTDIREERDGAGSVSDGAGRYVLCGIPADASLDIALSRDGRAAGRDRLRTSMATDRITHHLTLRRGSAEPAAPVALVCPLAATGPGGRVVRGTVRDADTAVPLAQARLSLEVPGGGTLVTSTETDGSYVFCGVPGGVSVRGHALFAGSAETAFQVPAGDDAVAVHDVDLRVNQRATLTGRVLHPESGVPLANAEVIVHGTHEVRQLTDRRGRFLLDDLPPGPQWIEVRHIAVASDTVQVDLRGARVTDIELRPGARVFALEALEVVAERSGYLRDFAYRRQRGMGGAFLTPEDHPPLRNAFVLADALTAVSGVDVRRDPVRHTTAVSFRRSGGMCPAAYFVDGVHWPVREGQSPLDVISPAAVAAIEVYRSSAETPGEFLRTDGSCGAVVVWTRRGSGR